jgi:hypothetical protein
MAIERSANAFPGVLGERLSLNPEGHPLPK